MLHIADIFANHTSTPKTPRRLQLVASGTPIPQTRSPTETHTLVITPKTPLVVVQQPEYRTLVHAIAILYARGLFPQVSIAGLENFRLTTKLQTLASALGVRNQIHFLDIDSAVALTYQHQLFVIMSDTKDILGLLRQGMAAGCTLVSSTAAVNTQAMHEIGLTGQLIPPQNPQALAAVLEGLLRSRHS